jgi:hypothetical protein
MHFLLLRGPVAFAGDAGEYELKYRLVYTPQFAAS